jgi:hypothetical protein
VFRHLAPCHKVIASQGLLPVQLESALDFNHQGDRNSGTLLPPLADARSQPRHRHDEEIALVRALS